MFKAIVSLKGAFSTYEVTIFNIMKYCYENNCIHFYKDDGRLIVYSLYNVLHYELNEQTYEDNI